MAMTVQKRAIETIDVCETLMSDMVSLVERVGLLPVAETDVAALPMVADGTLSVVDPLLAKAKSESFAKPTEAGL